MPRPQLPALARYQLISSEEDLGSIQDQSVRDCREHKPSTAQRRLFFACFTLGLLAVISISFNFGIFTFSRLKLGTFDFQSTACDQPAFRREWRSLSVSERLNYIDSVQCLRTRPSRLGLNQSLYDDFPYVHNQENAHGAAKFVAWHRYFLIVYEKALQQECGLQGFLPYWDWTLDWQDVTKAPVWNSEIGFGGNGDPQAGGSLLKGHCVVDGPFAMLQVSYVKSDRRPHCLSRGFAALERLHELGELIRPDAIENLLREESYNAFNLGLEYTAHNAIPRSIQGDFLVLTAPYDPVFFLHHAQLDRLWWKWQQMSPERKWKYDGVATVDSSELASTTNSLGLGELAPGVQVADIMDTNNRQLCYMY